MMTIEQTEALEKHYNESTGLSWLWAFCFGPIWFLYIGAGWWALGTLVASICTLGAAILVYPFLAYPAHRYVARRKVKGITDMQMLNDILTRNE